MNICMITNNYTPYSGGVVSSISSLTEELQKQGHRVTIITLDFEGAPPQDNVIRITCVGNFSYRNNPMTVPIRIKAQLRELLTTLNPDIIHTHHPFLLGQAAQQIARELNSPIIFTHHTQYENYVHYVPLPAWLSKLIVRKRIHNFCKQVDAVIVPTPSIQTMLTSQGITTPLHVIASSILPIFSPRTKTDFEHDPARPCKLITVSRFATEKNITWLLDTAKLLTTHNFNYEFTLIGYGAEQQALMSYAYDTLALPTKTVTFIEKPPKEFIKEAYHAADLFVFASTTETQGLVLAEAMSQSTPVIALTAPGTDDIVIDTVNGQRVHTPLEMAITIQNIYANKTYLKHLSTNALTTAHEYLPHHTAECILALYNQCLTRT